MFRSWQPPLLQSISTFYVKNDLSGQKIVRIPFSGQLYSCLSLSDASLKNKKELSIEHDQARMSLPPPTTTTRKWMDFFPRDSDALSFPRDLYSNANTRNFLEMFRAIIAILEIVLPFSLLSFSRSN